MMEIKIDKTTRMVNLAKTVIGNDAENLQETLVFKFINDFVDGQARLEYMIDGEKYYIPLTKDGKSYTLPVKNVLTKEGKIQMQLVITEGINEEDIPVFKSNVFYLYCNQSINAVDEAPSSYELWIEQANAKLNLMDEALTEVDNLDIDVSKTGNTATIEITNKNGVAKSVQIIDGTDGKDGVDGKDGKDGVNGKDGVDGKDGINGTDGISPTATISKSGNTATITITDKNGTTTATVSDGTNGTNGTNGRDGYVQYTAGENITIENNVISATAGVTPVDFGGYIFRDFPIGDSQALDVTIGSLFPQQIDTINEFLNECKQKNKMPAFVIAHSFVAFPYSGGLSGTYIKFKGSYILGDRLSNQTSNSLLNYASTFSIRISYRITDGTIAMTGLTNYDNKTQFLGLANTASYTPTGDYNPATKKYVDDAIASAITTTLGGSY